MKLSAPFLKSFSKLLTHRKKLYFCILIIMAVFLSFIETLGISAIMPFISVAADPNLIQQGLYSMVYTFFQFDSHSSFVITFGISIMAFYVLRAVWNIVYSYLLARFSTSIVRELSERLFNIYLHMPYASFLQQNSSTLTNHIMGETNNVSNYLLNTLQIFPEICTMLLLYTLMIAANWKMTLILTLVLALVVHIVVSIITKINRRQGILRTEAANRLYRIVGEALGNFKFIMLRGNSESVNKTFKEAQKRLTRPAIINTMLNTMPRFILENFGFIVLIAIVIYITWKYQSAQSIIPTISLYALAMYRILPAMTRCLANISTIVYNQHSIDVVFDDLTLPLRREGNGDVQYRHKIRADNISFSYVENKRVLHHIGLTIQRGEKIAVVGQSGGGKSTFVDLLIGLHRPEEGSLFVDDTEITDDNIRSWRARIGYIPQTIYLFDATVGENIAFGSVYDEKRIEQVLQLVRLWDALKDRGGIHTRVGDGGIQLSGGQKQRIGIARAIYNNPDVLVLDEATSALDTQTEAEIMEEIYRLSEDKTLIVIAHRLSTVELCDRRVEIRDGSLIPQQHLS